MATPVIMPKFGMAQEEGTIIRWLKNEGDRVEVGDILLEVQTDKVDMEVESIAAGILRDVRYGADATVPVTTVIAVIAGPGEEARIGAPMGAGGAPPVAAAEAAPAREPRVTPVAQRLASEQGLALDSVSGTGPSGMIMRADVERTLGGGTAALRVTPAARRLARDGSLALESISGSGPQGRIQAEDVRAATALTPASVEEPVAPVPIKALAGEPLRGMRRTIAARLSQSWQTVPHIFLSATVDMTRAEELRAQLGGEVERSGGALTPTVVIARAVAAALRAHPRLNATLRAEGGDLLLEEEPEVHLGIAVALEDGLIVPVVRDAGALGLAALAGQVADLGARARAGRLLPDEVAGGTFTISNLGMYPVDHFTAIINPPQVAILAVGRAQMAPQWDGSGFVPRLRMQVTLSADHRAVDGAVAAAFLATLKQLLEEPLRLLL